MAEQILHAMDTRGCITRWVAGYLDLDHKEWVAAESEGNNSHKMAYIFRLFLLEGEGWAAILFKVPQEYFVNM